MHRGVEVDLHLRTGLHNESFVAEALGNLAAYGLGQRRGERLAWQVLRVEGSAHPYYRLVVRHPSRSLDLGFGRELRRELDDLSSESVDELRKRYASAQQAGLHPVPLRHVKEAVDLWHDDFWNWLG